tara:strand:+ start:4560 stop:4805 length:246 start_codon:yes stop_codon:yes gene_type:complete
MRKQITEALSAKYQAEYKIAEINLYNYFNNPVGIGEHPDIVAECDTLISKMTDLQGKIDLITTASHFMTKDGVEESKTWGQ